MNARILNLRPTSLAIATLMALGCSTSFSASAATPAFTTVAQPTSLERGDAMIGALPMNQSIHVVVALKLRNRDVLDALVANNAKAQIARLRPRLMSSEQIMANHAPTPAQAQQVADYLTSMGFRNVTIAANRLLVSADGTAAMASNAFLTTFAKVTTHDGRVAFANTDAVRVPASLQGTVLSVLGLQNVHISHTFAKPLIRDAAHTTAVQGHSPTEFPVIYGGGSAAVASGVAVGIVTSGNLTQVVKDLNTFTKDQGLTTVSTSTVNTGTAPTSTSGTNEWDLDSQDIVGMAGGKVKQLIFYNAHSLEDNDLTSDFNTVESADAVKIINVSLGGCETGAQEDGSARADDQIFELATAQGQTFSVAAGDLGADECADKSNTPSWPASSQYTIAATGTTLNASTTTWSSETVWVYTGGSESTFEPRPDWQTLYAGTYRGAADVAFDGDPNSGSDIIVNGALAQYGGTSLSAPLFAGMWARVLQTEGSGYGFAGPAIYELPAAAFHDITSGKNSGREANVGYSAKVGYDLASGRGSIILGTALADLVVNNPPVANFSFTVSGLSASFTDSSTDSDSMIASHAWNFDDGSTSTAANPTHTFALPGTYSVAETVTDNRGATDTKTESVKVNWPAGSTQLLQNPGFESGVATPWVMSANVLQDNAGLAASGNWYAEIGAGYPASLTDTMYQTVAIPSGKSAATLEFSMHIATAETTKTTAVDKLTVHIISSTGAVLATVGVFSNLNANTGYLRHSFDMTPYIGQTVSVKFSGTNNTTLPTTWALDNFALEVSP